MNVAEHERLSSIQDAQRSLNLIIDSLEKAVEELYPRFQLVLSVDPASPSENIKHVPCAVPLTEYITSKERQINKILDSVLRLNKLCDL